jgi:hypothetical protein
MLALSNVLALKLRRFFYWRSTNNIAMVLTGCSLLCASILPWLKDPLGKVYCAWQLPTYTGWLYPAGFLNYGLLCLLCALYAFLFASSGQQPWRTSSGYTYLHKIARFAPFFPVLLFLFQYLCADMSTMALLANHERQMLFIQQHFNYQGTIQLITLNPLTLDISTLWDRLLLLLDCISYAPLLLCTTPLLLHSYQPSHVHTLVTTVSDHKPKLAIFCCITVLLALFVRAPVGILCEYTAKDALAAGNYEQAQVLLNAASLFNPEFEQVAYYHAEQGQAQYFLSGAQLTTDGRVYLANRYRTQGDYLDAYQQLLVAWHAHPTVAWIGDEVDRTLESMIEARGPLRGQAVKRINVDDTALPWLQVIAKVDPSNAYAIYIIGRIDYDLHDYSSCIASMSTLLQPNAEEAMRSSIYTYMALSETGLGNYTSARLLLFKAIASDPSYHNNTAREELSGLH